MAGEETIDVEPTGGRRTKSWLGETARFLVVLFLLAYVLRAFVVAPFNIPSPSMLPRLLAGDYLLVAKWPYGYSRYSFPFGLFSFDGRFLGGAPTRGDIIVFRFPGKNEDYIKRLIGLPGDQIQMRSGTLYINGDAVPKVRIADFLLPVSPNSPCPGDRPQVRETTTSSGEQVCSYQRYRETLPGGRSYEVLDEGDSPLDNTPVYLVPEGHYFMMGDNRDDSFDSRYYGPVERKRILGHATAVVLSFDKKSYWLPRWHRFFSSLAR